jgi:DNA-binding MarR family transcriptional regulator
MSTRAGRAGGAKAPITDWGILLTAALGVFKEQLHAQLVRAGYDDLGPAFGFVFRSLAERPLSLAELAARLGMTSQGALKIVAAMAERGYVERQDDLVDRRVRRLSLSARGRAALREARRFHVAAERRLVQSVGAKQVASARAVLAALVQQSGTDSDSWAASVRGF